MRLRGHLGLSQRVKACVSSMAAFNAKHDATQSEQSTVHWCRGAEVSKKQDITGRQLLPKLLHHNDHTFSSPSHKKLRQYIMSNVTSKADGAADKLIILPSYLSHYWVADSATYCTADSHDREPVKEKIKMHKPKASITVRK